MWILYDLCQPSVFGRQTMDRAFIRRVTVPNKMPYPSFIKSGTSWPKGSNVKVVAESTVQVSPEDPRLHVSVRVVNEIGSLPPKGAPRAPRAMSAMVAL